MTLCIVAFGLAVSAAAGETKPETATKPRLVLEVRDESDGQRYTPARFSLLVDGREYIPDGLNKHGLVFKSVHESKQQVQTITYARGTGPVELTLPETARRVEVRVAKGIEYFPVTVVRDVASPVTRVEVSLARWANLGAEGWFAADEHVHYDRLDPAANGDWFTMLAGDDLSVVHFMMAKGGQAPGEWARQYAYGPAGEGFDGERLLTAGEEYRDHAQGHINLLGVSEVIEPVITGDKERPENYPPLYSVFIRARELGAFNGVAHGASLGRSSTAVVDTVLGAVDFFEIANSALYAPELWYRLMNCGYHLPPAAGTDLPNVPFRDPWQPFLGSMRMYVRVGDARDFATWREGVERGEVFITAGPLLSFTVNGRAAGSEVNLPAGGTVVIEAEMSSPREPQAFELIMNGESVAVEVEKTIVNKVHRWRLRHEMHIEQSSWLAVRGVGAPVHALKQVVAVRKRPTSLTDAIAHSSAIPVLVGGKPIRLAADIGALITALEKQREFYRERGRYKRAAHREEMAALFDRAIARLEIREQEAQTK